MKNYEMWELPVGTLEYYDDEHIYLFEGQILPSITQLLKIKFGNKYMNVSKEVLERAAEKGTQVHNSIENYEINGIESDLKEFKNYLFLKKHYKWQVEQCEVPVILFKDDKPIACGRLDLAVNINDKFGILDIKRTATFDKEYVAYQTNLYRIGYRQTYGKEAELVGGIHLREEKRKFYNLPIDENMSWKLINDYLERGSENEL